MWSEGEEIVRDALARALYDAAPVLFEGFRVTVLDGRPAPCDPAPMLAQRIVRELEHAGYYLARDRHNKSPDRVRSRLILEDHIVFAIERTPRVFREMLDSQDRAAAGSARAAMTKAICATFNLMKVSLRKRRATSD